MNNIQQNRVNRVFIIFITFKKVIIILLELKNQKLRIILKF